MNEGFQNTTDSVSDDTSSGIKVSDSLLKFSYDRLFPSGADFFDVEDLKTLGIVMTAESAAISHSSIPAGYTYLGQFIDHDLSRLKIITPDGSPPLPDVPIDLNSTINECSPFFDLESLYGKGPAFNKELYESNTLLKVGETMIDGNGTGGVKKTFPNDLPRKTGSSTAELIDDRNDENLAIAQTHVAFIKFHNAVVKSLGDDDSQELFEKARETVVRHYQWAILHDYLPRIIKYSVLDDVLSNGNKFFFPTVKKPFMPVEFAGAAFRFGHSMVRNRYQWNKVFRDGGTKKSATLSDLIDFTGSQGLTSGTVKKEHLLSVWAVDWRRFYEFQTRPDPMGEQFNFAPKIDTGIAPALGNLRQSVGGGSLAFRNLLRGWTLRLPTGQAVAQAMRAKVLDSEKLKKLLPDNLKNKFSEKTPLWFYILAEAEIEEQGERLGEIGSRIVAETFAGLIKVSPISILREPDWKPFLGQDKANEFKMPDLLKFIAAQNQDFDELNPLGD